MKIKYKGKVYQIEKSKRKGKQKVAIAPDGTKIHFGDPTMREYPGTKRGNNFCARTISQKTKDDPNRASFWSRRLLWGCVGKKSYKDISKTGLEKI